MLFIAVVVTSLLILLVVAFGLKSNKVILAIFVIGFPILIRSYIVQPYQLPAGSMLPAIMIGDHILVNKYIYHFTEPEVGDVIIFPMPRNPKVDYVKRIVATGNDVLEIVNKKVIINGKEISEPYAFYSDLHFLDAKVSPRDFFGPIAIPENYVFVLGDNRDNSYDSRFWGLVNRDTITAKAEMIYWSRDKSNNSIRWNRIGNQIM